MTSHDDHERPDAIIQEQHALTDLLRETLLDYIAKHGRVRTDTLQAALGTLAVATFKAYVDDVARLEALNRFTTLVRDIVVETQFDMPPETVLHS